MFLLVVLLLPCLSREKSEGRQGEGMNDQIRFWLEGIGAVIIIIEMEVFIVSPWGGCTLSCLLQAKKQALTGGGISIKFCYYNIVLLLLPAM